MKPGDVFWNNGRICVHLPNIQLSSGSKPTSFAILVNKLGKRAYELAHGPAETGKVICNIVDIFEELYLQLKDEK